MEDKTRKILEFLEPFGIGSFQDISPFLNSFYPIQDIHDTGEVHSKIREPQDFFRGLIQAGYIKGRDTEIRGLGSGNSSGGYQWFPVMRIEASIDSKGLEVLALERAKATGSEMERSVFTTNASIQALNGISIKFMSFQKTWIVLAAIGAFAAAVISFVSLFKEAKTVVIERPLKDSTWQKQESRIKGLEDSLKEIRHRLDILPPDTSSK